jgi:hypothetical protein
VGLVEALGARIRALRSVGHSQGMQLHTDMHALAGVRRTHTQRQRLSSLIEGQSTVLTPKLRRRRDA